MNFEINLWFPDSITAIVHNENSEPQTVVLSRADAEALGIQLDPQNGVLLDRVEKIPKENLTKMVREPQQKGDILPSLVCEEHAREKPPKMVALDELLKVEEPLAEPELVPKPSTSIDVLSNIIQVLKF